MKPSRCLGCMRIKQSYVCEYCGYRGRWGEENPPDALPLEKILRGQYLVGRYLDRNDLYIEYTALDLALDRPVVLRELFPKDADRKQDGSVWFFDSDTGDCTAHNRELFIREARGLSAASQLSHVLTVYNLFTENDTEYLVTEFWQGGISLAERLQSEGPMALEEALSLLEPVGMDLQRMWGADILPWWINTGSILCLPSSGGLLKDLGAAPDWIGFDDDPLTYYPFRSVATYVRDYSRGPWDPVFSLCGILCCCLLGYGNISRWGMRLEDQIPRLPVPETVKDVLTRGMAEKAENRIQSPAALFQELRAALR